MPFRKRPFIFASFALLVLSVIGLAHDNDSASRNTAFQAGYSEGYRAGYDHGQSDSRNRAGYNFRSSDYNHADRGYSKSLKHKDEYKRGFQQAYQLGYRDGYNRNGFRGDLPRSSYPDGDYRYGYPTRSQSGYGYPDRDRGDYGYGYPERNREGRYYPGSSGYGNAYELGRQRGYQDGINQGANDLRKNRNYDPGRHGEYRDADKGYNSNYGDKRDYQAGYRNGFENGYRESFGRRKY